MTAPLTPVPNWSNYNHDDDFDPALKGKRTPDPLLCAPGHDHAWRDVGLNLAKCDHCGKVILHALPHWEGTRP